MKSYPSMYALLAALAATTTAAPAMETASTTDVSILGCRAEQSFGPSLSSGTSTVETGNGIRIIFENRGAVDLSRVTFAVEQDGQRIVREDVGRFSPGARIDRYFAAGDLSESGSPVCSVVAVRGS